jgi:hypothetical protein
VGKDDAWLVGGLWLALCGCSAGKHPDTAPLPGGAAGGPDRLQVIDRPASAGAGTGASGSAGDGPTLAAGSGAVAGSSSVGTGVGGAAGAGVGGSVAGAAGAAGVAGSAGTAGIGACDAGWHACSDACRADDDATACGADCEPCAAPEHGAPLCESGECSRRCDDGYLSCPDRSCGPLRFGFESGTLEGLRIVPENSRAAVGSPTPATFEGRQVVRVDLRVEGDNRNLQVRLDPCAGAAVDGLGLGTLSVDVRFDGPSLPAAAGAHEISLSVWTATSSYAVGRMTMPATGIWHALSGQLSEVDTTQVLGVGVYVYINGAGSAQDWTGTVYLDDVRID